MWGHAQLFLQCSAEMWAIQARQWPSETRWRCIRDAGEAIAHHGDVFFATIGGKDAAHTAPTVNRVARGLGCLLLEAPEQYAEIFGRLHDVR